MSILSAFIVLLAIESIIGRLTIPIEERRRTWSELKELINDILNKEN